MTNLSERIRAIAPGNAVHYRLKMQRHDGSTQIPALLQRVDRLCRDA